MSYSYAMVCFWLFFHLNEVVLMIIFSADWLFFFQTQPKVNCYYLKDCQTVEIPNICPAFTVYYFHELYYFGDFGFFLVVLNTIWFVQMVDM